MKHKTLSKIFTLVLVIALVCLTFTGCTPASTSTTGTEGTTTANDLTRFLLPVLLIVVFYFFLIRPENKKKKKLQEMRNEISVGDEITTIGGMVGKIVSIKEDMITFETGEDRVRIQVMKWAISTKGKANTQN